MPPSWVISAGRSCSPGPRPSLMRKENPRTYKTGPRYALLAPVGDLAAYCFPPTAYCSSKSAPLPAVAFDEVIGLLRPPASRRIESQPIASVLFPAIENRIHELPGEVHGIGAIEQRGITEHTIEQQGFISGGRRRPERFSVKEFHLHGANLHGGAGQLG